MINMKLNYEILCKINDHYSSYIETVLNVDHGEVLFDFNNDQDAINFANGLNTAYDLQQYFDEDCSEYCYEGADDGDIVEIEVKSNLTGKIIYSKTFTFYRKDWEK